MKKMYCIHCIYCIYCIHWHLRPNGTPYNVLYYGSRVPSFNKFRSMTTRFRVTSHFERPLHRITRKMTLKTTTSKVHSICNELLVSLSPKYQFHNQQFSNYRQLWDKCTDWPQKGPWILQGQRYVTSDLESEISICFAPRRSISSYMSFWDQCTEWFQNDLKHCKVKYTPYMYTYSWYHLL